MNDVGWLACVRCVLPPQILHPANWPIDLHFIFIFNDDDSAFKCHTPSNTLFWPNHLYHFDRINFDRNPPIFSRYTHLIVTYPNAQREREKINNNRHDMTEINSLITPEVNVQNSRLRTLPPVDWCIRPNGKKLWLEFLELSLFTC